MWRKQAPAVGQERTGQNDTDHLESVECGLLACGRLTAAIRSAHVLTRLTCSQSQLVKALIGFDLEIALSSNWNGPRGGLIIGTQLYCTLFVNWIESPELRLMMAKSPFM